MKDYSVLSDLHTCQWAQLVTAYDKGYDQGYAEGQKHDLEHTENIVRSHEKCNSIFEEEVSKSNTLFEPMETDNSKIEVGDKVVTVEDFDGANILFPIGTVGIVKQINEYSKEKYKVAAGDDWWWYREDMIELVKDDLIKIGDIVETIGFSKPVIVISVPDDNENSKKIKVMNFLGDTAWKDMRACKKTGKHIQQIEEVFEQLKNE